MEGFAPTILIETGRQIVILVHLDGYKNGVYQSHIFIIKHCQIHYAFTRYAAIHTFW